MNLSTPEIFVMYFSFAVAGFACAAVVQSWLARKEHDRTMARMDAEIRAELERVSR